MTETKGEILMSQVHNWGHKWNYDFDSIKHILELAGFKNIQRMKVRESKLSDIKLLESVSPRRTMETCYVEAKK